MKTITHSISKVALCLLSLTVVVATAQARDIEYKNQEVQVNVNPGEPTQIHFPGVVQGGFKKKRSSLSLDKRDQDLVIFASDSIGKTGEAILVRLDDGRSYSMRVTKASDESPRDATVRIVDKRDHSITSDDSEEEPEYVDKNYPKAPANSVAGLLREMVLVAEFGKDKVQGYRVSDSYKGEQVLNDGTMQAKIDKIFIGSNYWGYVIDTQNMLDQTQKLNPATFRLDGTRAVSAQRWELAPQPLTAEQQVAAQHMSKVYVVTRARKSN